MKTPKGALFLIPPAAVAVLLGVAVMVRSPEEGVPERFRSLPPAAAPRQVLVHVPAPPARVQPPARPDQVAAGMDAAAYRSVYDVYRTAVASGNVAVADKLKPRLLEQRSTAVAYARKELEAAREEPHRRIAESVLRSLER
jgi:hypothetical protein